MAETAQPAGESVEQYVNRNYRWNFIVNAIDGSSFWFGMSFISAAVILPLFVSNFTSNPFLIGLIPFIGISGSLIPQLFMANRVERAPIKKFFPVVLGFFLERLPVFLLIPLSHFLAPSHPRLTLALFFVLISWNAFGAGMIIIGWQDMIGKIMPADRRGRFFGITNFLGSAAGILGALAVPFVLERAAFPDGYTLAFAAASLMIFISWVALSLTREPAVHSSKPRVSQAAYFKSLPAILRGDPNFRAYLFAQIIFTLSGMAVGFLVVYAVRAWNLPDAQASGFTIALQVGMAAANLFFGFFSDRKGHKLSLEICFLISILAFALAPIAPSALWFFVIFFLRGVVQAALFISGIAIVYEFTGAENRATYIGLSNTLPGIAGAIAPLIGGALVSLVSYQAMFIVSVVFGVAAWALLRFGVRDPRAARPAADEASA